MTLARATLVKSLALALPAALLLFFGVEWLREREREQALERVLNAYQTDLVRQTCETDPQWFLAGPRTGRPSAQDRLQPDADVRLPRPSNEELPFEIFAFDHQFSPTSPAGPRFPEEFKRQMRASEPARFVRGTYTGKAGTGLQMAKLTGWTPGPCAILLVRLQPTTGQALTRLLLFAGLFTVSFAVAYLSLWPTTVRIRKLAEATRASARQNYTGIAKVSGNDEISALGSTFNDTAADIRQRITDAQDRGEALQRYVASVAEGVAEPLAALEQRLANLDRTSHSGTDATELRGAIRDAHNLNRRLQNLAAVAHLRTVTETSPRQPVDLRPLVERVVATRAPLAHASQVTVELAPPDGTATVAADATLIEQAVANVIDNAILYNRPGGKVRVELRGYEHGGRFSLRVIDNGPGVNDEEFAGLTANKRFRGDEARTRRPGGRGLGLALAREVADRFGMLLELRRPTSGGFEVEIRSRS